MGVPTMISDKGNNMYNMRYDIVFSENTNDLNKLFCTFTDLENLDDLIENIRSKYKIIYNKIFVLEILGENEYIVTYNVDPGNVSSIPSNTIFVHRKKESNTLYSINSLNELIAKLNGGVLDTKFQINWSDYKNSILLTQNGEFNQLKTKLFRIVNT